MRVCQDVCRGSVLAENGQNFLHVAPLFAAGIEFTVGVSSCPAFAKAIIGFWIYFLAPAYQSQVFLPLADILAPLHDDGAQSQFYQPQGSKQSAGACPHDNDLWPVVHHGVGYRAEEVFCRLFVQVDAHREIDKYRPMAGIDASAEDTYICDVMQVQTFLPAKISAEALSVGGVCGKKAEGVFLNHPQYINNRGWCIRKHSRSPRSGRWDTWRR